MVCIYVATSMYVMKPKNLICTCMCTACLMIHNNSNVVKGYS